jgi:hypothetical protein
MMRALAFGGKPLCVTGAKPRDGRTGTTALTPAGPGSDDEAAPPVMGIPPSEHYTLPMKMLRICAYCLGRRARWRHGVPGSVA